MIVRRRPDLAVRLWVGEPDIMVGAALPSGDAALKLVRGEPGAIVDVGGTVIMRGALIAVGLALAGFSGAALLKGTIGAVLAVEAGVLAWAYRHKEAP
jgi:hypothetical protein